MGVGQGQTRPGFKDAGHCMQIVLHCHLPCITIQAASSALSCPALPCHLWAHLLWGLQTLGGQLGGGQPPCGCCPTRHQPRLRPLSHVPCLGPVGPSQGADRERANSSCSWYRSLRNWFTNSRASDPWGPSLVGLQSTSPGKQWGRVGWGLESRTCPLHWKLGVGKGEWSPLLHRPTPDCWLRFWGGATPPPPLALGSQPSYQLQPGAVVQSH